MKGLEVLPYKDVVSLIHKLWTQGNPPTTGTVTDTTQLLTEDNK